MKRVIALMVLAAALLTLCACGKSKAEIGRAHV